MAEVNNAYSYGAHQKDAQTQHQAKLGEMEFSENLQAAAINKRMQNRNMSNARDSRAVKWIQAAQQKSHKSGSKTISKLT